MSRSKPPTLVSLVVPIYNVADYLGNAWQVFNHRLHKPGDYLPKRWLNPDSSLALLKRHAARDGRIIIRR